MKHTLERKFNEGKDVCLLLSVLMVEEAFGGGKGKRKEEREEKGKENSALATCRSSKS